MTVRAPILALALLLGWAAPAAAQEPGGWLDRFNRQMFGLNEQLSEGVDALRRMGTNLTQGGLGTRDVASELGMEVPRSDIGLALCRHGVPEGPYVVLPIVGPRTLRDAVADLVVTNAIIYVALMPVFGPLPGLMTVLVIEVLDEAAALAVARQIDSAQEAGGDFDEVRDRYLASRARRCAGA